MTATDPDSVSIATKNPFRDPVEVNDQSMSMNYNTMTGQTAE